MPAHAEAPDAENHRLWFVNGRIHIHVSRHDTADGLSIVEHHLPLGFGPPLHVHRDEDEFFHIIEGLFRFQLGTRIIAGMAGDVIALPRGVPHGFRVLSGEGGRCLTIRAADSRTCCAMRNARPITPASPIGSADARATGRASQRLRAARHRSRRSADRLTRRRISPGWAVAAASPSPDPRRGARHSPPPDPRRSAPRRNNPPADARNRSR